MKIALNSLIVLVLLFSCKEGKDTTEVSTGPEIHKGVVQEVLHVKDYTYVRMLENDQDLWLAVPLTNVEKGGTYFYSTSMEMKNFESKELNRSFETIYFIERISTTEEGVTSPIRTNPHSATMRSDQQSTAGQATKPVIDKKEVNVPAAENTIRISELFKNRDTYNNKVVRLRGQVTKYNPAIMNVNWLHIQDGTDHNGEFDLTVTSTSTAQVGDVVTVEGTVSLNKDFGAGYTYDVIIENASISK